jgi:hypothetical protein
VIAGAKIAFRAASAKSPLLSFRFLVLYRAKTGIFRTFIFLNHHK